MLGHEATLLYYYPTNGWKNLRKVHRENDTVVFFSERRKNICTPYFTFYCTL